MPSQAVRHLEYNDAGRLFQLFTDGELTATYTYNAYGQRTRKVTADGTIIYHYDQAGQLISETRGDGTPIRDYIRGDGELVAQIDVAGTERVSYLHSDHLYTPRLATDVSSGVLGTQYLFWSSVEFWGHNTYFGVLGTQNKPRIKYSVPRTTQN